MMRLLLTLALIAVAISGCMENAPSSEKMITMMAQSVANVSSYSYEISYAQTTSSKELINNKTMDKQNSTTFSIKGVEKASLNLTSHARKVIVSTLTSRAEAYGTPEVMSSNATEYNIGNTTYGTAGNDTWIQQRDTTPEDMLWADGRYNLINSNIEFINRTFNQTQAMVVGSENIDGRDCYKLKLTMDNRTHSANAYGVLINSIPSPIPLVPEFNETELLKSSEIDSTIWVEKGTYFPRKYQVVQSLSIIPNIIGILDFSGNVRMLNQSMKLGEISTEIIRTEIYYDYNKPLEIEPPQEALNATPNTPALQMISDSI